MQIKREHISSLSIIVVKNRRFSVYPNNDLLVNELAKKIKVQHTATFIKGNSNQYRIFERYGYLNQCKCYY